MAAVPDTLNPASLGSLARRTHVVAATRGTHFAGGGFMTMFFMVVTLAFGVSDLTRSSRRFAQSKTRTYSSVGSSR